MFWLFQHVIIVPFVRTGQVARSVMTDTYSVMIRYATVHDRGRDVFHITGINYTQYILILEST